MDATAIMDAPAILSPWRGVMKGQCLRIEVQVQCRLVTMQPYLRIRPRPTTRIGKYGARELRRAIN